MNIVGIIPARYASTRFPGKPLALIAGKPLIQRVVEQCQKAKSLSEVVVATDDSRISAAVKSFGGRVVLTRRDHPSGTDRVAEVARQVDGDMIVNLQGDEPLVEPAALDLLPELLRRDRGSDMATLAVPITNQEQWENPNCVKVVRDANGRALFFSRSPIPFVREGEPDFARRPPLFLQHLGLYAYRRDFLVRLAQLPTVPLEETEKLEQLRVLAVGKCICVGLVQHAGRGVDTPADYARFVESWRQLQAGQAA